MMSINDGPIWRVNLLPTVPLEGDTPWTIASQQACMHLADVASELASAAQTMRAWRRRVKAIAEEVFMLSAEWVI